VAEVDDPMRTVLISGGSKGLGAALVAYFLSRGHRVATFSRSPTDQVESWRAEYPDRLFYDSLSLTDKAAVKGFVDKVQGLFGDTEVLVNNAGIARSGLLPLFSDKDVDTVVDLNLKGTFYISHLVSRPMLSLGWGRIINISSIVGLSGYRGLSVYGASKAGLDGFTRALARELGPRNITVNSVAPGFLSTEMNEELDDRQIRQIVNRTPMGRLGTTQDVAELVGFLASPAAGFITGQVIPVDGGITS
jgi:3-oxoacyl-[acyl-carrier protein] reductase